MKTHVLTLPALPPDVSEHDLKMILGGALYSQGVLSSGRAAELVGIDRRDFLLGIGHYGVSVLGSAESIMQDIATARSLFKQ